MSKILRNNVHTDEHITLSHCAYRVKKEFYYSKLVTMNSARYGRTSIHSKFCRGRLWSVPRSSCPRSACRPRKLRTHREDNKACHSHSATTKRQIRFELRILMVSNLIFRLPFQPIVIVMVLPARPQRPRRRPQPASPPRWLGVESKH